MTNRTKEKTYTIDEFEAKGQELLDIAFTMSVECLQDAENQNPPIGKILAEAVMIINYALQAFIAIERLKIK